MALFFSLCLPSRKAGGLQIPSCQGIAVADYSFTLDALALKPSSFCNVGVDAQSQPGDESIHNSFCELVAGFILNLLLRFEAEFLAADGRLVNQPAFSLNKYHHPLMIAGFGLGAGGRAGTGTRRSPFGTRLCLDAGRDRDSRSRCLKLEFPAGEFIV